VGLGASTRRDWVASKKDRQKRQRRRAREGRAAAARETPDRRATFTEVLSHNGVKVEEQTFAVVVEPIRLDDGEVLMFQSPHVPPFYLLTAKQYRDRAEPKRVAAVTKKVRVGDDDVVEGGSFRPLDPIGAFDALEGLAISVILSAAAIEAHANDMIRRLPDEATVEVERKAVRVVYERDSMERALSLEEKVTIVGPQLTGGRSIKGTTAWEAYRRVVPLRNELMHMKSRVQNDADSPGPFGLLMLGQGSRAPEDAAAVIHAVEPEWIPLRIRSDFGLT
jgi:hypothetical protein